MASVVGLALLLNCRTWWQVADSILNSQRKRLHSAANNLHKLKSEGFMKVDKFNLVTLTNQRLMDIIKYHVVVAKGDFLCLSSDKAVVPNPFNFSFCPNMDN